MRERDNEHRDVRRDAADIYQKIVCSKAMESAVDKRTLAFCSPVCEERKMYPPAFSLISNSRNVVAYVAFCVCAGSGSFAVLKSDVWSGKLFFSVMSSNGALRFLRQWALGSSEEFAL